MLTDLAVAGVDVVHLGVLQDLDGGVDVSYGRAQAADDRQRISGLAQLAVFVITATFFIRWIFTAYENSARLGPPSLRFGTGWAVGGWFVPILSLWRPKQIVNDAWRASEPDAPSRLGDNWCRASVPAFLTVWWVIFILQDVIWRVVNRLWLNGENLPEQITATQADFGAIAASVVGALLAIHVVRRLTRRQEERIARLSGSSADGEDLERGSAPPAPAT